jgi:hypothetical protein
MTVSTLQPTTLTGSILGISSISTNTLTANIISTNLLAASTISLNSFTTNQAVYGQTVKKTSMPAIRTITINSSDIKAELDNTSIIPQVYTFGSTIQNRWVAAGAILPTIISIAYSNNGIEWQNNINPTNIFTQECLGIAWNGSIWVAVGKGINSMATSPDGINWARAYYFTEGNGIAWGGNKWVAVGYQPTGIATSDDGTNWTGRGGNLALIGRGVAWNGSRWVVVGGSSASITPNPVKIAYSDDGVNWSEANTASPSNTIFDSGGAGVAWNGIMWIAVGDNNTTNSIAWSTDGTYWTGLGKPVLSSGLCIAWNGTIWVAGGIGVSAIATSFDGLTWTASNVNNATINQVYSVAWNGSVWIAIGDLNVSPNVNGRSIYSYDGMLWIEGNAPFSYICRGIAFNYRRPYTLTFSNNANTPVIGSTSALATFPITIPQDSQLDICSDSYYNSGYTNFSMLVRGQFS